jgi:microcystin-dependent protein
MHFNFLKNQFMKKNYLILVFVFFTFLNTTKVSAQLDPLIGQISMFAGDFAPRGWALCNGQLMSIQQNIALFSIIGTIYGGDGVTTFALPDLRGRVPVGPGQGPGLSTKDLGEKAGLEQVTLTIANLPAHSHQLRASTAAGTSNLPTGNYNANTSVLDKEYINTTDTTMNSNAIGITGSNIPISLEQPYLSINFIIATEGVFPSRN